jgi:hypothetical protein
VTTRRPSRLNAAQVKGAAGVEGPTSLATTPSPVVVQMRPMPSAETESTFSLVLSKASAFTLSVWPVSRLMAWPFSASTRCTAPF